MALFAFPLCDWREPGKDVANGDVPILQSIGEFLELKPTLRRFLNQNDDLKECMRQVLSSPRATTDSLDIANLVSVSCQATITNMLQYSNGLGRHMAAHPFGAIIPRLPFNSVRREIGCVVS